MAEELLNGADVGTVDEELGRVSVTERVRRDFLYYSRFAGVFADDVFDGDGGETGGFKDVLGRR